MISLVNLEIEMRYKKIVKQTKRDDEEVEDQEI